MALRILVLVSFILNSMVPAVGLAANSGAYGKSSDAHVRKRMDELAVQGKSMTSPSEAEIKKGLTGSVFKACQNVNLVDYDSFKAHSEFWAKAAQECEKEVGDIQPLPETGFLTLKNNDVHTSPLTNVDFLKKVGGRTVKYLEQNHAYLTGLEKCFSDTVASSDCTEKKSITKQIIKDNLPELRAKLALVSGSGSIGNFRDVERAIRTRDASAFVNRKLGAGGGLISGGAIVAKDLQPLTDSEVQAATKEWNKVLAAAMAKFKENLEKEEADIRKRYADPKAAAFADFDINKLRARLDPSNQIFQKFVMNELFAANAKHISNYHQTLQKAPIMSEITRADLDDGNYLVAVRKLKENAKEEKDRVAKIVTKGDKDEMLEFMKNVPVVEEVISEDPRVCSTAQGLVNYVASKDTRHAVGIMAGMLTFGIGATIGLATIPFRGAALMSMAGATNAGALLGSGAGFGLTAMHKRDVDQVERQAFSRTGSKDEKAVTDMEALAREKDGLVIDYALAPANLIGLGFIGRGFGKAASVGMLKMQGLETAEAKKLVQLTASKDKVIAEQAKKTLEEQSSRFWKDLFGRAPSKDEQLLIDTAAAKSFDKKIYAEELARRVNRLGTAAEKREFIRDVTAALNNLDPSKLNDLNRLDVLRNISAAGRLGMKDPKRVAGLINEWTTEGVDGIKGLTNTYELAATKLATATGKSQAEKVEYAFASALREQIDSHPSLKNLGKEEKSAMVARMCTCPGMCPK